MIAALVLGSVAAVAVAGLAGWLLGRRSGSGRTAQLEKRLALVDEAAGRKYREKLAPIRRRLGFIYLDGLPSAGRREVLDLFESGVGHASQAEWERAGQTWTQAQARASGAEVVALKSLCGACRVLLAQPEKARAEFASALAAARQTHDGPGIAASLFALGELAREQNRSAQASRHLEQCEGLCRSLGMGELGAAALVRLAALAEGTQDRDRALDYHQKALRALEEVGDRVGVARQYGALGQMLFRQGELDKARAAHEDGLLVAKQIRDRHGEAERLAAIGTIHRVQGDANRALELLERASRIFEEIHQQAAQARALHELALIHEQLGESDAAQEYYEHSLAAARKTGDRGLQSRNLEQMAEHCLAHEALDKARAMFEEASQLDREDSRRIELCHDLTGLGRVALLLGEIPDALRHLDEALALCRKTGDRKAEPWVLLFHARALQSSDKPAEALEDLERAQSIARRKPSNPALPAILSETGALYAARRDWQRSLASYQAAADLHGTAGEPGLQALDLVGVGVAHREESRFDEAKTRLEDALRLAHTDGDTETEAKALTEMAAVNEALGHAGLARENLRQALRFHEDAGDVRGQAECLLELGRLLAVTAEHEEARTRLEQAARLFLKLDDRGKAAEAGRLLAAAPGAGAGVNVIGPEP